MRMCNLGPEVISPFHAQLNRACTFKLLIKTKMLKNIDFYCFQTLRFCINHVIKCQNVENCWHLNIYEHDKFHAQLSDLDKYIVSSTNIVVHGKAT